MSAVRFAPCSGASAQPEPGENVHTNFLDRFEGTWRATEGRDTLLIRLKKVKDTFTNAYFSHYAYLLAVCHTYTRDGVILSGSIKDRPLDPKRTYACRTLPCNPVNYRSDVGQTDCSFIDRMEHKGTPVILTFLPGGVPSVH